MFKPGDIVEIVPSEVSTYACEALKGLTGTVMAEDDDYWDVLVHFPKSRRVDGVWAFFSGQIKLVEETPQNL